MLSLFRPPLPPLRRHVALLWLVQDYVATHVRERALPTGCASLIINLRDDRWSVYTPDDLVRAKRLSASLVGGARDRHLILDPREQRASMGAEFTPAGAAALLGVPASELANVDAGLADLWGDRADALRERLLNLDSPHARLATLEAALLDRLRRAKPIDPLIENAAQRLDAEPGSTVRRIARDAGVSDQRFIRRFREDVGLAPKRYARVRRFQAAVRRIGAGLPVDWSRVAADCGFYDQPHLIREFRDFAGVTPTEFARGDPDRINHVIIG